MRETTEGKSRHLDEQGFFFRIFLLLVWLSLVGLGGCSWTIGVRDEGRLPDGSFGTTACRVGPVVADAVITISEVGLTTAAWIWVEGMRGLAEGLACGGDFPESTCTPTKHTPSAAMILLYLPAVIQAVSAVTGGVNYHSCKKVLMQPGNKSSDRPDYLPASQKPSSTSSPLPPPTGIVTLRW